MKPPLVVLTAFTVAASAAPPGANVSSKLVVPDSLRSGVFATDRTVNLPPGFRLSVWARVPNARFIATAPTGEVLVSQPDQGRVTLLRPAANGEVPAQSTWLTGLRQPHGLAFDTIDGTTYVYVAETDQLSRYAFNGGAPNPDRQILVRNLPSGGHSLKSVAIAPDHSIYLGIGSSCNACASDTTAPIVRGSVYRYQRDGSSPQLFAQGLRNPEGLDFLPGTDKLWAAVNNRDEIRYPHQDSTNQYGQLVRSYIDDHPPELFTSVRQGGNYGWPFCNPSQDTPSGYANMPFDQDVELNREGRVDCGTMDRVSRGIQAHSAPLGFRFLQGSSFAAPYRDGAVIALHGSWNRTEPTGYKVVWLPWNLLSGTAGAPVDLISGLYGFARPVGLAPTSDGALLITDDSSGAVYRLEWMPSAISAANGYPVIAPGSYASVYSNTPLPANLDSTLEVTGPKGRASRAQIIFASPLQINFVVPDGIDPGTARLSLNTTIDLGSPEVRTIAPGLFTLTGDGRGPGAVTALDTKGQSIATNPIDMSSGPVFVSLYGTGIRNADPADVQVLINDAPVRVLFAGAQPTFPALDQINIELPQSLAGSGKVSVTVSIRGTTSNTAELAIR